MGHDHQHGEHRHDHERVPRTGALRLAFFINLAFTLIEVFGGWWTGSIAVYTDALHDAGDCLVLGLAWWLQHVAMKGRDAQYSYGYGRYSMLGGWLASIVLIVGAVAMLIAAVPRLWEPTLPDADRMLLIAVFGLVMNGFAAWKLHAGHSLNERGAYLHLLEDVLGWAAVLIGAVLIHFTGWAVVDPLLSIAISLFIAWNAIGTLRKGTGILMQETPKNIDQQEVRARLLAVRGVIDLHDQHTWTLDGSYVVHTVHLVVSNNDPAIKAEARHTLHHMGIDHATIELEGPNERCELEHH